MSKNYCNCPNCQTQDCPAGAEEARLKAELAKAQVELVTAKEIHSMPFEELAGAMQEIDRLNAKLAKAQEDHQRLIKDYRNLAQTYVLTNRELESLRSTMKETQ